MNFPIIVPAIRVEQRLGVFFITSLPASLLLDVCYVLEARILEENTEESGYQETILGKALNKLTGTQRKKKQSRIDDIKKYTETVDASFPNSIILGANYEENGKLADNTNNRWFVEKVENDCYYLTIPTAERLASIIDGQHRVYGFENSTAKDTPLVCSIFLDLPVPYHAQIFTTINMNQKKVDKNLAYNLFQFEMDEGNAGSWSPETLAVYYARILAQDTNSPLNGKLKLGISDVENNTSISMASVIDGILSLITSNPKEDRVQMHRITLEAGRDRSLIQSIRTNAPLRKLYIEYQDKALYELILAYLKAVDNVFWQRDIIVFNKTLGVQALFDVLKEMILITGIDFLYSEEYFTLLLEPAKKIHFESDFFAIQSKLRSRIKKSLLLTCAKKSFSDLRIDLDEIPDYRQALNL